jgi:two-component system, LytTR family, sensor kinase
MMNINRYHFYFWACFYSAIMLLDYTQSPSDFNIVRQLYIIVVDLSIFYSFLVVLMQFKKGSVTAWIRTAFCFLLSFTLVLFLNYIRGRIANHYNTDLFKSFRDFIYDTIYIYLSITVYAVGYYYLNRSKHKEKELRQLAEEKAAQDVANAQLLASNAQLALVNAEMKQDMLELENNFLRAQINPHFLYNTLNIFYNRAMDKDEELAESIIALSEIMRYSLETSHGGQLVPLQMEVEHLQRVIGMYQLRFDNKLRIEFTVEGQYSHPRVVPLIFITLLENALKHGKVDDAYNPVTLWLCADATHIYFTIRNKKAEGAAVQSHGVGLANIRKRLDNVYGNRCRFGVEETADSYHVILAIEHSEASKVENGVVEIEA